jgi:hypothetical protein
MRVGTLAAAISIGFCDSTSCPVRTPPMVGHGCRPDTVSPSAQYPVSESPVNRMP